MRTIAGTDLLVFPLCLGSNAFGWTASEEDSFAVLDAYAEAGGNFIDTADMYSQWNGTPGIAEQIIGRWMQSRGNRDRMIIASKVAKLSTLRGLSAVTIAQASEASMTRLQTDYIDLYYAHEDDESVPMEESLRAFHALVTSGRVRAIGASNFSAKRLAEALRISESESLTRYVAVQPHYNLIEREFEDDLAPAVAAENLSTIPYRGVARGFLTGKYSRDTLGAIESPWTETAEQYLDERGLRTLDALRKLAADHGVSMGAVALAWLGAQPTVVAPIVGARSVEQLADLLPMTGLKLSDEEQSLLSAASL